VASLFFALIWVATWLVTAVTWERDADGNSVGMDVAVLPLHFILPVIVGLFIWLARSGTSRPAIRVLAFAGVVFGFAEFGVLWLVDALWIPAAETIQSSSEIAAEAVAFAVVYAIICAGLAVFGGRLGREFAMQNPQGSEAG